MAEGVEMFCAQCGFRTMAWSEGNPYFMENGEKVYAYHPDHDALERCTENDVPFICLDCGHEFWNDTAAERSDCARCASPNIVDLWELEGKQCPKCHEALIERHINSSCIS